MSVSRHDFGVTGTFPTAPRRTGLAPFSASGSPVVHSQSRAVVVAPVNCPMAIQREPLGPSLAIDVQQRIGFLHYAYLRTCDIWTAWPPSPWLAPRSSALV